MKKSRAFIVIFLSFFCHLNAQNTDLFKVYLKSGLILKAELVKVIPDSLVQIKQYGMLTNIKFSEIDSLVFDESLMKTIVFNPLNKPIERKHVVDSGWSFGLQPGFTLGIGGWGLTSSFTFRTSILRGNGKLAQYGFNLGIDPYILYENAFGVTALEGRQYFKKQSHRSPFVYGTLGYGFNLTSPALGKDGGVNTSIGFGNGFRTRNGVVFSFMFGYRFQRFRELRNIWRVGDIYTYNNINRFECKFEWRY